MKLDELIAKHSMLQNVRCGVSIGDGWCNLIDVLCGEIDDHLEHHKDKRDDFKVAQVKEKFGGLRFYTDGNDEYISGTIALAESLSYTICEECGNPGKSNSEGWIKVRCKEHK